MLIGLARCTNLGVLELGMSARKVYKLKRLGSFVALQGFEDAKARVYYTNRTWLHGPVF